MFFKTRKKEKRNFLRRSKKSVFFWKTVKKIEKWLTNFFSFQMSNDRNSEKIDWKKKKKNEKQIYKKGWTNEKSFVFRTNKGD